MSPELENELVRKYPKLFAQHNWPVTRSLMAFGCEHGDGWYKIIDEMCSKLQHLLDTNVCKSIAFVQIKEKFATLRVYEMHDWKEPRLRKFLFNFNRKFYKFIPSPLYSLINGLAWVMDPVEKIINEAERKSAKTCEVCGAPGKVNTEGYWLSTRCAPCRAKENK